MNPPTPPVYEHFLYLKKWGFRKNTQHRIACTSSGYPGYKTTAFDQNSLHVTIIQGYMYRYFTQYLRPLCLKLAAEKRTFLQLISQKRNWFDLAATGGPQVFKVCVAVNLNCTWRNVMEFSFHCYLGDLFFCFWHKRLLFFVDMLLMLTAVYTHREK